MLGNICGLENTVVDKVDKIYPVVTTQLGTEVLAGETVADSRTLAISGPHSKPATIPSSHVSSLVAEMEHFTLEGIP